MGEAVAKSAPSLTRRAYGRVLMLMARTCSWRAHAPAILSHRSCVPAGYRRRALWRVSVSSRDHLRSLSFFFSCDSCSWCGAHHGVCASKIVYVHVRWCMCMGMGTQKRRTMLISHHVASHHIASTSAPTQARPRQGNAARHAARDQRQRAHGLRQSKRKQQETAST
jgi:hypothetical protein